MQHPHSNLVLVPTDFSEVCDNAISHAAELARYMNFRLLFLHIINKDTKSYLDKAQLDESAISQKLNAIALKVSQEYKIEINTLVEKGDLFRKVAKVAQEKDAALVILGTHGKLGFQRLTGSYALKIISNIKVPTLVVQKRLFTNGYKNIVFPVTTYTADRQKVRWAVAIAKTFEATIHIMPRYESENYLKRNIMSVVKQIKTTFVKEEVKFIDKVSDDEGGNFAKQVIDYAVMYEADLIMVMTVKDKLLPMLDSLDEQLIFNSSQIPVICINPIKLDTASWY